MDALSQCTQLCVTLLSRVSDSLFPCWGDEKTAKCSEVIRLDMAPYTSRTGGERRTTRILLSLCEKLARVRQDPPHLETYKFGFYFFTSGCLSHPFERSSKDTAALFGTHTFVPRHKLALSVPPNLTSTQSRRAASSDGSHINTEWDGGRQGQWIRAKS